VRAHTDHIEKILSVLFDTAGAKRTKNAIKGISPLRSRRGLRALDLRKLLKKFDQNFSIVSTKKRKLFAKPLAFAKTM
jgi:hypothetical protein